MVPRHLITCGDRFRTYGCFTSSNLEEQFRSMLAASRHTICESRHRVIWFGILAWISSVALISENGLLLTPTHFMIAESDPRPINDLQRVVNVEHPEQSRLVVFHFIYLSFHMVRHHDLGGCPRSRIGYWSWRPLKIFTNDHTHQILFEKETLRTAFSWRCV